MEHQSLRGDQVPRVRVVPDGDDHPQWEEIVEFVEATGTELDPWQVEVLRVALMRRDEQWAAFAVAVCAPRQNGKNGILEMRELVGALVLDEKLQIHTAHLADTSKEGFRRLDELIDANEWLSRQVRHIWRTNGHESIEFVSGNRIRFRTRTRGGGRGFSGSPVFFDEAMYLPAVSMGSILPVISAQPDPQVWYMGSAVDRTIMDDAFVFARVRDRAFRGEDERLAYMEWSIDADSPEEVTEEQLMDMDLIASANPAFGKRISAEYVVAERSELDTRTFAVERLGVGDWPPVDGSSDHVIPLDKWDALVEPLGVRVEPACYAFDVTPDRASASICVAGRRPDGLPQVEVVEHRSGTGWVAGWLVEHGAVNVVCDGSGPAGSLIQQCEDLGVAVTPVPAPDQAKACGRFFDVVDEGGLRHLGSLAMRSALKGAAKRSLGDAWAWSRRNSTIDISPLVGCTLALWCLRSAGPGWRGM
jgi:hypothetical protein